MVDGEGVAGHSDLLLGGADPVQHSPPALHWEVEVAGGAGGPLVDAQHCCGEHTGLVSESTTNINGFDSGPIVWEVCPPADH